MSVKDNFFSRAPFNIRKGKRLGFGKIPSLEDLLLVSSTDHFTTSCGAKKNVADVLLPVPQNIEFRRTLRVCFNVDIHTKNSELVFGIRNGEAGAGDG
jgi:hypothetical protein